MGAVGLRLVYLLSPVAGGCGWAASDGVICDRRRKKENVNLAGVNADDVANRSKECLFFFAYATLYFRVN